MNDYNQLINFKWGTVPFKRNKHGKLSNRWFFYKPNTGNLTPAPQAPFTCFNSNPYFGGYSSGYGIYEKCTWSTPKKSKNRKLIGFTHFTPSGSGDIKNFYNYFLIKPSKKPVRIKKETYSLNGYSIKTSKYFISSIVNRSCINYIIKSKEQIIIDPSYGGLNIKEYKPNKYNTIIREFNDHIEITANYNDLDVFFNLKISNCDSYCINDNLIYINGKKIEFSLSYSFISIENSINKLSKEYSAHAISSWQKKLDTILIDAPNDIKRLFYTALYTAFKRPHISYESDDVFDYMTLWDMYKTEMPLLFLLNKDVSTHIVNGLKHLWDKDHFITSRHLTTKEKLIDNNQAICLANLIISTAKIYGIDADYDLLNKYQEIEFKKYINNNLPIKPRLTHNLDFIDAIKAYNHAFNKNIYNTLDLHKNLYDNSGVELVNDGCEYYEGTNTNYSFRVSALTNERMSFIDINLLNSELDRFFGFTSKPCKYFNHPTHPNKVKTYGNKIKRFEGLNNEPDMESPYLYSYLNEYNKQNEVLNEIMKYSFNINNDGLPGNDDTGALSSWLVFNILGIFPVVGTDKFKIGCPLINNAILNLDNEFKIDVKRKNKSSIYLDKVILNNKLIDNFEISINDIRNGGILEIYLN